MAPTRSFNTDQAAAQITRGNSFWGDALGQPTTVTYAYRDSIPAGYQGTPIEAQTFQKFTAHQIQMTDLILGLYQETANVKLVRVSGPNGYSNDATFLFGNYANGTPPEDRTYAYSYSVGNKDRSSASTDGDFWYNLRGPNDNGGPPLLPVGSDNYTTVLHEIGHSFGLEHPSDYPPNDFNYDRDAYYIQDSLQYSVMSYLPAASTGADFKGSFPRTLLLDDIAALQRLYGANMTTRVGNDTYGFGGQGVYALANAGDKAVFCIWDAGGNDTFNMAQYTDNQVIDLNAEHFSSTGGLKYNMSIAKGVTIENAIGGSGNDIIVGNAVANIIAGGAGNDTMAGGNGNDIFIGGPGRDIIDGQAGIDSASYTDKTQPVVVTLNGSTFVTVFINGVAEDQIANIEIVYGGTAADTLTGDGLANCFFGGAGDDVLVGGAGSDLLVGGTGNDRLTGGADADVFRFDTPLGQTGVDTLVDFTARTDKIQLSSAIFGAIGPTLTADEFDAAASGNTANPGELVIYDKSTGQLWYDADSDGPGAAVLIAQLGSATFHTTTLANTDFLIA